MVWIHGLKETGGNRGARSGDDGGVAEVLHLFGEFGGRSKVPDGKVEEQECKAEEGDADDDKQDGFEHSFTFDRQSRCSELKAIAEGGKGGRPLADESQSSTDRQIVGNCLKAFDWLISDGLFGIEKEDEDASGHLIKPDLEHIFDFTTEEEDQNLTILLAHFLLD